MRSLKSDSRYGGRRTAAEWRAFYHWEHRRRYLDLGLVLLLIMLGVIVATAYDLAGWLF